jgi:hypothetical protein
LRIAIACIACLCTLVAAGCAKQDSTIARLEGSEPQRLAFGPPLDVQKTFAAQMQSCWFSTSAPLAGYQYDTTPAIMETGNGLTELPQISIRSQPGRQDFVVQFYPFNDNTLISTRNISLPLELSARLKRDVETWTFGRASCDGPTGAIATVEQQSSTSSVEQAGSWSTSQEAGVARYR